jgi:hypothetical protein
MRIGTISFTAIDNYGATLQAYALARLLGRNGHETSIIDYQLPDLKLRDWLRVMHLSYSLHAPLTVAAGVPELFVRTARMEKFRKQYLNRTKPAWTDRELREIAGQFDALVTGSDEIFRTDRQGNVFPPLFLNFADPEKQKLFAYAACSGGTSDYDGKNAIVARLLNRFDGISVRDEVTRELVKKLTGKDPRVVLDPTLLWDFAELPLPAPPRENYVLTYGFYKSPRTDRMVREVADKMGASVVSVGWAARHARHNLLDADPLQWLACFKHARLVFTNCYHGLMFATHYRRDFLVFEAEKARSKINDFAQRFSLESRLVPGGTFPSGPQLAGMDHDALQQRLKPYVEASAGFISEIGRSPAAARPAAPHPKKIESWEINSIAATGQPVDARGHFGDVMRQIGHLFWEAALSPITSPPIAGQVKKHWPATVGSVLMFLAVLWFHHRSNCHLIFLPLYLLPSVWLSTRVNLRLGVLMSLAGAAGGALIQHYADDDFRSWQVVGWNIMMRFVTIHLIVSLIARLRRQQTSAIYFKPRLQGNLAGEMLRYWLVLLAGLAVFAGLVGAQRWSSPHLVFMPFYLMPCLIYALVPGWGWGVGMAIAAAFAGAVVPGLNDPDYNTIFVIVWNFFMRLTILLGAVLMVNSTRHRERLFARHYGQRQTPE